MSILLTTREIEDSARELISAASSSLGVEVTTPLVYPNGECVTVVVAPEFSEYVVHDAGLGSIYLEREGVRVSRDIRTRAASVAARYECAFIEGRMTRRGSAQDVAVSVMLVANATKTLADLAAEARRQSESQFRYLLTERVREVAGARLKENEVFRGKSGASYRIANTILDAQRQMPIAFIVPIPSRGSVANQFRELYDLQAAYPSIDRESVYDEGSDFRATEDGWMLGQVGKVAPFSSIGRDVAEILQRASSQFSAPLH